MIVVSCGDGGPGVSDGDCLETIFGAVVGGVSDYVFRSHVL